MGVSTPPAQGRPRRSTPSRRVEDLPVSIQDYKVSAHHEYKVWFTLERIHKATTPCFLTLLGANPSTNTYKDVLRVKYLITKLLDGLEVFLGVCVCDVLELQQLQNGRGEAYI